MLTVRERRWLWQIKARSFWLVLTERSGYPWRDRPRMLLEHFRQNRFLYSPYCWVVTCDTRVRPMRVVRVRPV